MKIKLYSCSARSAFTVVEMVVCFAILGLVIGGMLTAYSRAGQFATRAGYELAAEGQAVKIMEKVRAANWDTSSIPPTDNTTNFPFITVNVLELPISGTNVVYCTNYLKISTVTNDVALGVMYKMIQITSIWPWNGVTATNTIMTYRAPDQ